MRARAHTHIICICYMYMWCMSALCVLINIRRFTETFPKSNKTLHQVYFLAFVLTFLSSLNSNHSNEVFHRTFHQTTQVPTYIYIYIHVSYNKNVPIMHYVIAYNLICFSTIYTLFFLFTSLFSALDQIIPLITQSFKKNFPLHCRHSAVRNWTVFSSQQAIKRKKKIIIKRRNSKKKK